jgi:hypothetical protein
VEVAEAVDGVSARLAALVHRRRIFAYATIMVLVVVVAYPFQLVTGSGVLDRYGQVKGTDFVEFYAAGQLIAAGHGPSLYHFLPPFQFPAQFSAEASFLAPQVHDPHFAFIVAPYYALPFVPLSALPYLPAYAVWFAGNVALFGLTLRLLRPYVGLLQGRDRRLAILVAASFFPVLECLVDGQNAIVSLFLFAVVYIALRRDRDVLAGVALGFALYKPQLVLTVALLVLVGRRWRAVLALLGTGLALLAISFAIVGTAGLHDYLRLSLTMPGWVYIPGWRTWNMHSLNSFFVLLVPVPWLARLLTAAASIAVLLPAIAVWRTAHPRDPAWLNPAYALAVLATVLVSPHVFAYDLALLVIPGLLLADGLAGGGLGGPPVATQWLRVFLAVGYLLPLPSRFFALTVRLQPSVLVIAGIFAATYLLLRVRPAADAESVHGACVPTVVEAR